MTCIRFGGAIVCVSPFYRLPLRDGARVFMEWHHYCGPTFYRDRDCNRIIEDWYDDPRLVEACQWFIDRGEKA